MYKVTHVNPMSLAKVLAAVQGSLGLLTGILFSLGSILSSADPNAPEGVFGVWAFLALPLVNIIFGFISGFLVAWVYNLVAAYVGGIKIIIET